MDVNRKELSVIKEVLKDIPRGMTVTEISRSVKMNRHSVAKYLEVLVAAGYVDMKTFGPSKIYYLSQRIPISAMLSFSSDLIFILDKDLRIRNLNDKLLEYMRLKREDMLNKNIENFAFTRLTEPPLISGIKDALNGIEKTVDTYYHSGERDYYLVIKFIPAVFEDGEKGVTIIASDYTEHKRIEQAVRESERKFRNMLEQSTDGIIMSDEEGVIIEYNDSLEQLTGYKKEDIVGKYIWQIPFFKEIYEQISGELNKKLKDYANFFLGTGESPLTDLFNEYEIKRPDGTTRSVHANVFPIKTDKGFMLCAIARDITGMKKTEAEMRDSEEKFRSVIEQSMDGIALIDSNGSIIEFNEQLERISGLKKEDVLGKAVWDAYGIATAGTADDPPGSIKALKEKLKKRAGYYKDNGKTYFEIDLPKPNEERRILQVMAFPINIEKGKMMCAIVRDITGQKQAEEALLKEHGELEVRVKERTAELEKANQDLKAEIEKRTASENALSKSEERFRNLVESINDIAWEKDKDGKFTYMGPKIMDVMGYEPREFIGKTILDFMLPSYADTIREAFWQTFREPMPYSLRQMFVLHKDGHKVYVEANGIPTYDDQGKFKGYRGVTRDITARVQAEEALHKIEDKHRALVENINDIVWEMDTKGRFVYVNPKVKDIMGYDPEHYLGKTVMDFMPPEDAAEFSKKFSGLLSNPKPFALAHARMYHNDRGVRDMEANGTPFFNEKGEFCGFMGVTRDITKR